MQVIWKQKLECAEKQTVELPKGAKVLCVQAQNDEPCIWFLVSDPGNGMETRTFAIHGTGHQRDVISGQYVGTFQLHAGTLVFHLFEED